MCGIVGYIGAQDAAPILLEGLGRLEYRGYDSAGVAVVSRSGLKIRKSPGSGGRPRCRAARPVQGRARDRAHALGHPRRADRRTTPTRTPTPPAASPSCTTGSSRTPTSCAPSWSRTASSSARRPTPRSSPHLIAAAFAAGAPDLEHAVSQALRQRRGRVRHRRARRRPPGPDRRRPQRQPGAAGGRRARDVRRLRRRRARRLHPPGRLPRRRRARDDHRRRVPDVHPGRPVDGQEPGDDRLGHHRRRDRRPRALPAEGDRRAAEGDRADAARPARRAVLDRAPRRAQPVGARGPRVPPGEDPRLRLGLLRRATWARS